MSPADVCMRTVALAGSDHPPERLVVMALAAETLGLGGKLGAMSDDDASRMLSALGVLGSEPGGTPWGTVLLKDSQRCEGGLALNV